MNRSIFIALIFVTALLRPNNGFAQEKLERESRIKTEEVPVSALMFVDSLDLDCKVKWYLEESLNGTTIEAKSKRNGQKISIEFDSTGNLEDIEIQVEWKTLSNALKDSISAQLGSRCLKHNIRKVQIQYSGEREVLLNKMKMDIPPSGDFKIRFELVVKCKTDEDVALYEYLFSETGQVIKFSKIIFKNSSNLEY